MWVDVCPFASPACPGICPHPSTQGGDGTPGWWLNLWLPTGVSQPNLPALPCRPGTGPGQEDICQWEPSDGSDPLLAGGAGEFASDASFLALLGEGLLSLGLGAVEPDTYPCPMGFLPQRSCPGCPAAVVPFPPLRWEVSHKLRINHKKGKGFLSVPLPIIPLGYTPSGQG